jgi:CheY-like chemotaxis protein
MSAPQRTNTTVFIRTAHETPFSLKGYRVLLVEDNLVNQRVLRKQLEKIEAVVDVAGDGVEALGKIKESVWQGGDHDLEVVLLDLEMPVMGGLECVERIREMEKNGTIKGHLPVIVVSANARGEQIEQARLSGSDDFVSKPFRIGELVPKIVELVKNPA